MTNHLKGPEIQETTILPDLKTPDFPQGYGRIWVPKEPIEDVSTWIQTNVEAILHDVKKAGCIKLKTELQILKTSATSEYEASNLRWENLTAFDGYEDLTQIPHWDWSPQDPVQFVVVGQQKNEIPRPNATCSAPTEVVGKALSAVVKKINAPTAIKSENNKSEIFEMLCGFLKFIKSPEQKIVILGNYFDTARDDGDTETCAAIFDLLQQTYESIQESTVTQNWQSEAGNVLFIHTGAEQMKEHSSVVHWAMPYLTKPSSTDDNLWRARI